MVSIDEGKKVAAENGVQYQEVSAKTGENVNVLFDKIITFLISKCKHIEIQRIKCKFYNK